MIEKFRIEAVLSVIADRTVPCGAGSAAVRRPAAGITQPDPLAEGIAFVANIKSQIKRNRQNEARRMRNRAVRSELRTREKAVVSAAAAGESTDEMLRLAQKRLDKAAAKGVIHRNEAGRRKSRLATRAARGNSS